MVVLIVFESTSTENDEADSIGNTITGSLNRASGSTGTMIVGSGNEVTNSKAFCDTSS